jgi:hypothetical protein
MVVIIATILVLMGLVMLMRYLTRNMKTKNPVNPRRGAQTEDGEREINSEPLQ